jgi:septal ring factor EnvC (AmiA/AmiB activator)
MRTILWSTALSLSLVAAAGCKKDEAEKVEAAQKAVNEQREEVREAQQDVNEQRKDLAEAKVDLVQARAEYARVTNDRLVKIDARIAELEARADAESKKEAADLRLKRNQLAAKLDQAGQRTEANWEEFKADVDREFTEFEKSIDRAFE